LVALRPATVEDTATVVALYDEAVAWLTARGRTGQWGTTPFSELPDNVALIRSRAASGGMWLAECDARVLGAIVLEAEPPRYLTVPAGEPAIHVSGFITSRAPDARTVGRLLLDHARTTARARGIGLLRLDCYAGGDGGLVAYYESAGFTPVETFTVDLLGGSYHACLLEQRLP
jgi:GNAT superfamily N-acetyltransferase